MNLVEALRRAEPEEALFLLRDDIDAQKVFVAWSMYCPRWVTRDLPDADVMNPLDLVKLAWGSSNVDYAFLATLAGIPEATVSDKLTKLANIRLIFPDGSVSERALRMIKLLNTTEVCVPKDPPSIEPGAPR